MFRQSDKWFSLPLSYARNAARRVICPRLYTTTFTTPSSGAHSYTSLGIDAHADHSVLKFRSLYLSRLTAIADGRETMERRDQEPGGPNANFDAVTATLAGCRQELSTRLRATMAARGGTQKDLVAAIWLAEGLNQRRRARPPAVAHPTGWRAGSPRLGWPRRICCRESIGAALETGHETSSGLRASRVPPTGCGLIFAGNCGPGWRWTSQPC